MALAWLLLWSVPVIGTRQDRFFKTHGDGLSAAPVAGGVSLGAAALAYLVTTNVNVAVFGLLLWSVAVTVTV
jgi:hypothetical protein